MLHSNFTEESDVANFHIGEDGLQRIERILNRELVARGVRCALLIDRSGNIIAQQDDGKCKHDLYSFAALASANIAAVDTMASIVGEKEFSLLFHKGKDESTHFSKVNAEYMLITIFGSEMPLGSLRIKTDEASKKIRGLWRN